MRVVGRGPRLARRDYDEHAERLERQGQRWGNAPDRHHPAVHRQLVRAGRPPPAAKPTEVLRTRDAANRTTLIRLLVTRENYYGEGLAARGKKRQDLTSTGPRQPRLGSPLRASGGRQLYFTRPTTTPRQVWAGPPRPRISQRALRPGRRISDVPRPTPRTSGRAGTDRCSRRVVAGYARRSPAPGRRGMGHLPRGGAILRGRERRRIGNGVSGRADPDATESHGATRRSTRADRRPLPRSR